MKKWGLKVILYKKSYFESKNNISPTIITYILKKQRFSLYKIHLVVTFKNLNSMLYNYIQGNPIFINHNF